MTIYGPGREGVANASRQQSEGGPISVTYPTRSEGDIKVRYDSLVNTVDGTLRSKEVGVQTEARQTHINTLAGQLQFFTMHAPAAGSIHAELIKQFKALYPTEDFTDVTVAEAKAKEFLSDKSHQGQRLLLTMRLAQWEQATLQLATHIKMKRVNQPTQSYPYSGLVKVDPTNGLVRVPEDGIDVSLPATIKRGFTHLGSMLAYPVSESARKFIANVPDMHRQEALAQIMKKDARQPAMFFELDLPNAQRLGLQLHDLDGRDFDDNQRAWLKNYFDLYRAGHDTGRTNTLEHDQVVNAGNRIQQLFNVRLDLEVRTGRDLFDIEPNTISDRGGVYTYAGRRQSHFIGDRVGVNVFDQIQTELRDSSLPALAKITTKAVQNALDKNEFQLAATQAKAKADEAGHVSGMSEDEKEIKRKLAQSDIDGAEAKLAAIKKDREHIDEIEQKNNECTTLETTIVAKFALRFPPPPPVLLINIIKLSENEVEPASVAHAEANFRRTSTDLDSLKTELAQLYTALAAKGLTPAQTALLQARHTNVLTLIGSSTSGATQAKNNAETLLNVRRAQLAVVQSDIESLSALREQVRATHKLMDESRTKYGFATLPTTITTTYETDSLKLIKETRENIIKLTKSRDDIGKPDAWQSKKVELYELAQKYLFGDDADPVKKHEEIRGRIEKRNKGQLPFNFEAKYHDQVKYPKVYLRALQVLFGEHILLASGKKDFEEAVKLLPPQRMVDIIGHHRANGLHPPLGAIFAGIGSTTNVYTDIGFYNMTEAAVDGNLVSALEKGLVREATKGSLFDMYDLLKPNIDAVDASTYTNTLHTPTTPAMTATIKQLAERYYTFTDRKDLAEHMWDDPLFTATFTMGRSDFGTIPTTDIEKKYCARLYADEIIKLHKQQMAR